LRHVKKKDNISIALEQWKINVVEEDKGFALDVIWSAWIARNDCIFQNKEANVYKIFYKLKSSKVSSSIIKQPKPNRLIQNPNYDPTHVRGFCNGDS
jgi:hypothetical protein